MEAILSDHCFFLSLAINIIINIYYILECVLFYYLLKLASIHSLTRSLTPTWMGFHIYIVFIFCPFNGMEGNDGMVEWWNEMMGIESRVLGA